MTQNSRVMFSSVGAAYTLKRNREPTNDSGVSVTHVVGFDTVVSLAQRKTGHINAEALLHDRVVIRRVVNCKTPPVPSHRRPSEST